MSTAGNTNIDLLFVMLDQPLSSIESVIAKMQKASVLSKKNQSKKLKSTLKVFEDFFCHEEMSHKFYFWLNCKSYLGFRLRRYVY